MTKKELKTIRNKLGLTQSGLASAIGLAKNGDRSIRRWESGKWPIPRSIELALETIKNDPSLRSL